MREKLSSTNTRIKMEGNTKALREKRSSTGKDSMVGAGYSCCSVIKLCPTLCDPTDCSTPGFPVLHYLPKFVQTHVHCVSDAIQPSHSVSSFSFFPQSFPASGSFPMSRLFASGGQSIRASVSASVPSMSI